MWERKGRIRLCGVMLSVAMLLGLMFSPTASAYYCQPVAGYCTGCGRPQFPQKEPPADGKYTCYDCRAKNFTYVTVPNYPLCKLCKSQQHCGNIWDMCDYCIMDGDYSYWEPGRLTEADKQAVRNNRRPSDMDLGRACKDPAYALKLAQDLLGLTGAAAQGAAQALAKLGQDAVDQALQSLRGDKSGGGVSDYESGVKKAEELAGLVEKAPGGTGEKAAALAQKGIAAVETADALHTGMTAAEWEKYRGERERNPYITQTITESAEAVGAWTGNREAGRQVGEDTANLLLGWSNVLLNRHSDRYFTEAGREVGVNVEKLEQ